MTTDIDTLLDGLRPLLERTGPQEPIIADDDIRIGDIKTLVDEVLRLRERLRQRKPPKCSGCGHDLGIMWVCEGFEDPECLGHDG